MLPVEFAIKDPLRKEKAQWYDGAVKVTVLKEDESVAYDLVIFERSREAVHEWGKIETFIKDVAHFQFKL